MQWLFPRLLTWGPYPTPAWQSKNALRNCAEELETERIFFFFCCWQWWLFKCLISQCSPQSKNFSIHTPRHWENRFGVWWAACCWLLCFLASRFLNSGLNSCIFHLRKNCYQKTRQRIIVFCELTVKRLSFSQGPKADNVQPGEMVCVSEFILGCSFLLVKSLTWISFFKKFFSNMQLEGSESLMALATPAVLLWMQDSQWDFNSRPPPSPQTYQERK